MAKYELSKKWIQQNSEKIKRAYNIAIGHKFDIKSEEDILEVIKEVDPPSATLENAKILSGVLQIFAQQIVEKYKVKRPSKEKIIN